MAVGSKSKCKLAQTEDGEHSFLMVPGAETNSAVVYWFIITSTFLAVDIVTLY